MWRSLSLRARLTVVAGAALAAGLAAGAALLLVITHRSGLSTVDDGALRAGREVAELANTGQLPDPIPVTSSATSLQVVDGAGHVLQASANADHLVPLLTAGETAAVRSGARLDLAGDRAGLDTPLRVVGVPTLVDARTVIVAVGTGQLADSERVVRVWVLVTGPVLLAALGLLTWLVVGWTLRPVETLRRGAQDISGGRLDRRLPVTPARDEINRLATTLNGMLNRIDASVRRQRAFVSDAAHELRSPLASIRAQVEVAERLGEWRGGSAGGPGGGAADVLADVDRLSRLIDDLLLLARLDEGRPGGRSWVPVRLDALAGELASRYAGARVTVRAAGGVAPAGATPAGVLGDPDALHRLVTNLVDNAVRHARCSVTLRVVVEPPWAVLTVSDDGPGIPAADRERVFDRFARRDDARSRDAGGAGLGLPIARELARAHGGTVTLCAEPGGGLRATVRLPLDHTQPDG
ncbi:MAG TPA: HAMP domain-containing sensor histidine kinase [Mycobacteriales bacterium]|nr:HAMP domain-containing sensor histidine kinase [Mycobacteriales bacterium]